MPITLCMYWLFYKPRFFKIDINSRGLWISKITTSMCMVLANKHKQKAKKKLKYKKWKIHLWKIDLNSSDEIDCSYL
jgi:hypothetical protein